MNCPAGCRCRADWSYNEITGGDLTRDSIGVFGVVDCSNAGLTTLPEVLPTMDIKMLNITNNSITSLSPIVDNEYYQNIIVLYADDNQIKSIVELEGKFLENFFKISLRNNKIKEIPFYILSFLERNLSGKTIFLGGNRIHCDCQTFKNIRVSGTSTVSSCDSYHLKI
jgi:Leucine-rich repeat (LRR) protein